MNGTIAMDFAMVDEYVAALRRALDSLEELLAESERIAATLDDDGVWLGRGGEAAIEALRHNLKGSINRLSDRLEEAAQDVRQHAEAMRKAEAENAGRF